MSVAAAKSPTRTTAIGPGHVFYRREEPAPEPIAPAFPSLDDVPRLTMLRSGVLLPPTNDFRAHVTVDEISGTVASDAVSGTAYANVSSGAVRVDAPYGAGILLPGTGKTINFDNGFSSMPHPSYTGSVAFWHQATNFPSGGSQVIAMTHQYDAWYVAFKNTGTTGSPVGRFVIFGSLYYYNSPEDQGFTSRSDESTSTFGINQWRHLAVQFDQTNRKMQLHVNGVLEAEFSWAGNEYTVVPGAHWQMQSPGAIDDARFYNRLLTTNDLAVLRTNYGVVAHYTFDDESGTQVKDHSGYKHHATMQTNNITRGAGFRTDHGADFSGGRVTFPTTATLNALQHFDYSLLLWCRPDSLPPGYPNQYAYALLNKPNHAFGPSFGTSGANGNFFTSHYFDWLPTQTTVSSWSTFPTNQWHHIAVIRSVAEGKYRMFVNGTNVYEESIAAGADNTSSTPWYLGYAHPAWLQYMPESSQVDWTFDGKMDDVRLYNTALPTNVVLRLFYDTDLDDLPDAWELEHFGDTHEDPEDDYDGDGTSNEDEYGAETDPTMLPAPTVTPSDTPLYQGSVEVTVSTTVSGASLFYSLNGSDPSTAYSSPVTLTATNQFKAKATNLGFESPVVTRNYKVNKAPVVSIVSPTNGQLIVSCGVVNVEVEGSDPDPLDSVQTVRLLTNGVPVASDDVPPFILSFTNPPSGSLILEAEADDELGGTGFSSAVTVTITNLPAPSVTLTSPTNGLVAVEGDPIALGASGFGAMSWIVNGSNVVASDSSAPYTGVWTNATVGVHTIVAVATGVCGQSVTSGVATVTVVAAANPPPSVFLISPPDGARFGHPSIVPFHASAFDTNGTIVKVQFWSGASLLAEDSSAPFTAVVTNAFANGSTQSVHAVAIDNGLASTASAAHEIVVAYDANDANGDGLPDSLGLLGWLDADGDGANNLTEQLLGLSNASDDSDGDEMPDGWELENQTLPLVDDSFDDPDGDRYPNAWEYHRGGLAHIAIDHPSPDRTVGNSGTHPNLSAALAGLSSANYPIVQVFEGLYEGATNTDLSVTIPDLLLLGPGASARGAELDGNFQSRLLDIYADCVIDGLKFRHGVAEQGGGIQINGTARVRLKNCIVRNCSAQSGGGIHSSSSELELLHCTLFDNKAGGDEFLFPDTWVGGDVSAVEPWIQNSILWSSNRWYALLDMNARITNSIVKGINPVNGNLNVDPLLDEEGRLVVGSPAIDAGLSMNAVRSDVDEENRPFDGGPDIGADEWVDSDEDGLPDWWEGLYFGSLSGESDVDGDGVTAIFEYMSGASPLEWSGPALVNFNNNAATMTSGAPVITTFIAGEPQTVTIRFLGFEYISADPIDDYPNPDPEEGSLAGFDFALIDQTTTNVPAGTNSIVWDGIDPETSLYHRFDVLAYSLIAQETVGGSNVWFVSSTNYSHGSPFRGRKLGYEVFATVDADTWDGVQYDNRPIETRLELIGDKPVIAHNRFSHSFWLNAPLTQSATFYSWHPFGDTGQHLVELGIGYKLERESEAWEMPAPATVVLNQSAQITTFTLTPWGTIVGAGEVFQLYFGLSKEARVTLRLLSPTLVQYPFYFRDPSTGDRILAEDLPFDAGEHMLESEGLNSSGSEPLVFGSSAETSELEGIMTRHFRVKIEAHDERTGRIETRWAALHLIE